MTRILVVDDEPQIVRALRINLRARGYDVHTAGRGDDALAAAAAHPPDVVILDLGLPDMDGMDVIHGLRGWTSVPIIVLSGRGDSVDKVRALDAGADDYLTKPYGMDELLARIRAAGRRADQPATTGSPRVTLGDVTIDLAQRRATRSPGDACDGDGPHVDGADGADGDIRLTPTEWHLLEVMLRHPGKLLTQRFLLQEVWGSAYVNQPGNLRLYMAQLRRKLEPDPTRPRYLLTELGMGYRYRSDDPDPDES
jgi:two-component system KDP operon response regulator KdpE